MPYTRYKLGDYIKTKTPTVKQTEAMLKNLGALQRQVNTMAEHISKKLPVYKDDKLWLTWAAGDEWVIANIFGDNFRPDALTLISLINIANNQKADPDNADYDVEIETLLELWRI